ncbi:class F sortase [Nonomuraea soli]|uniref:LPXTG-site transpeptidase (Sortase) family protein n=1 Tax=Nonomuraea soli TaxID=1032476 RepID=A0A7W0CTU4_9ACTN|nr:class F sortase [Nonomuraea soli]MBA2897093.1 LPXTG-site transpeptidase (sortase) family protein [Nonomuraea soli]
MNKKALPALLVAGSLTGVGAIMAGLLTLAPSIDDGSRPAAQPVAMQNAAAYELPAAVGGGGLGPDGMPVPLTPARYEAPPPPAADPAAKVVKPFASSKGKARPTRIRIPKIKVNAPIGSVSVDDKGQLGTPSLTKPNLTAWYRFSPVPGEVGPAIINGHVNTRKGAAVFNRLHELAKGDQIYVYRSDGKVVRYTVSGIEQVGKSSFPTKRVYDNTSDSQLRLITCGGVYNKTDHSYTDNVIVYATLTAKKG